VVFGHTKKQRLQAAVTAAMVGHSGAAVVVAVDSGRLVAAHRLEIAARRLAKPGSSVKTFTLLALLQSGKVDAETSWMCRRKVEIGRKRLDCTHPRNAGPMTAATALALSCNDYFTHFGARLSDGELRDVLLRAGLASRSGLLPEEATGVVQLSRTLEERELQAVGEYGIEVTPVELLQAYRVLALKKRSGTAANEPLGIVLDGLEKSARFGMARMAQVPGLEVAGKTGTALADEGRWTHGWFAGYAPALRPEIAVVVYLERGQGPTGAAAIAGEIFRAYAAEQGP